MRTVAIVASIFAVLVLTGCGQTGPLYLPDDGNAVVKPGATEAPKKDEVKKTDDSSTLPTPP